VKLHGTDQLNRSAEQKRKQLRLGKGVPWHYYVFRECWERENDVVRTGKKFPYCGEIDGHSCDFLVHFVSALWKRSV
jgi:hypothetical protein